MYAQESQPEGYLSHPSWRNRLASLLLALATTVLIALLMLAMGAFSLTDKSKTSQLVAVELPQQSGAKSQHVKATVKQAASAPHSVQPPTPHQAVIKPPVPVTPLLHMSHEEFAATDISKLPNHAQDSGSGTAATGNSSSSYGPGDGPGGVHLFNAEWYREPTHAELATYLADTNGEGDWATIACKTIENYHVENCQELDESPPGSGLARALRRAAWQFLVRPPRVDGHVMVGAWVRIKFTFTKIRSSEPAVEPLTGADNGP